MQSSDRIVVQLTKLVLVELWKLLCHHPPQGSRKDRLISPAQGLREKRNVFKTFELVLFSKSYFATAMFTVITVTITQMFLHQHDSKYIFQNAFSAFALLPPSIHSTICSPVRPTARPSTHPPPSTAGSHRKSVPRKRTSANSAISIQSEGSMTTDE